MPFLLIDTAGLREPGDAIETIGIARAQASVAAADILLWLGAPADAPQGAVLVHTKADLGPARAKADISVSATTGAGVAELTRLLIQRSAALLPPEGEVALNARHRAALAEACAALDGAETIPDLLIVAEALRRACGALDRITGRAGVEDMLDALFGRFCIGK